MRSLTSPDTLLFDLDGTLLDIHMQAFLGEYFPLLAPSFGAERDVEAFREKMIDSVKVMLHNRDGSVLLSEIFLESFSPKMSMSKENVREALRAFTHSGFGSLRRLARPFPESRPLLEKALSLGFSLALATNPVFFPEAIERRIAWAGLERIPFRFVSSAENMHFCKPHREYFLEVLEKIGKKPGECVMIGNDPRMTSLPACNAGIMTFYVSPPGGKGDEKDADISGTLADLSSWLEKIKASTSPR